MPLIQELGQETRMTDPSPNTDSEAIDVAVDFKTEYLRLEDSITREREADVALGTLRTRLLQLIDGKIPFGDHSLYLLFTAIPNLATKILKNRFGSATPTLLSTLLI
jgi:hypothetical protein